MAKADAYLVKHGVPFETIYGFDWDVAITWRDDRHDYGEDRRIALGPVGKRYDVVV